MAGEIGAAAVTAHYCKATVPRRGQQLAPTGEVLQHLGRG
jgi:hypothetical protein